MLRRCSFSVTIHYTATVVKIGNTLTSASLMSDPSHFAIVNNEFVVKKSEIYEVHFSDSFANGARRVSIWFHSTDICDGTKSIEKIHDMNHTVDTGQGENRVDLQPLSLFFVTQLTANPQKHIIVITGSQNATFEGQSYANLFIKKWLICLNNMCMKRTIYNSNHIDKNLSESQISVLKALYQYYHKKYWLFKQTYKYLKKINLACDLGSEALVVTGTIAEGITLNLIVLGTISGAGVTLKTFCETKNFKHKIEMSKFAYTNYEKY